MTGSIKIFMGPFWQGPFLTELGAIRLELKEKYSETVARFEVGPPDISSQPLLGVILRFRRVEQIVDTLYSRTIPARLWRFAAQIPPHPQIVTFGGMDRIATGEAQKLVDLLMALANGGQKVIVGMDYPRPEILPAAIRLIADAEEINVRNLWGPPQVWWEVQFWWSARFWHQVGCTVFVGPPGSRKSRCAQTVLEDLFQNPERADSSAVAIVCQMRGTEPKGTIQARRMEDWPATSVSSVAEIRQCVHPDAKTIIVDGAHFLPEEETEEFIAYVRSLLGKGVQVVIAGLKNAFNGKPIGPVPRMIASGVVDLVVNLGVLCPICGKNTAYHAQRVYHDGSLPGAGDPILVSADKAAHTAACRQCQKFADFVWPSITL